MTETVKSFHGSKTLPSAFQSSFRYIFCGKSGEILVVNVQNEKISADLVQKRPEITGFKTGTAKLSQQILPSFGKKTAVVWWVRAIEANVSAPTISPKAG